MTKKPLRLIVAAVILGLVASSSTVAADKSPSKAVSEATVFLTEPGGIPLGGIEPGTQLTVLEEGAEWVKVSMVGWVQRSTLDGERPAPAAPDTAVNPSISPAVGKSVSYIGKGFVVRNITFSETTIGVTKARGEVRNESGKNFTMLVLLITAFDRNKGVIGVGRAIISNLRANSTKAFEGSFDRPIPGEFMYSISYEYGF